ncbi:hypothetical protein FOA52_009352 [Chlamydomonas sp. UWO 241]|nr:hypothetical protein FOA52_009352 [Chlamydomonas sp. UWO 241]
MAPVKKKAGGGKKKAPAFYCGAEDLEPFGFAMNDIIKTPLGVTGTVIGVKYESAEQKETGRVWVRYQNGHEAPLEPRLGAGLMSALGYRRCSEADHIRRDVEHSEAAAKKKGDEEKLISQIMAFKEAGLPIPEELIPKSKEKKVKKKDGDAKKKKK